MDQLYKHFCGIPSPLSLLLLYSATHHRNCHNATNVPHTDKTVQKQRINCALSLPNWKCLLLQSGENQQRLTGDEESIAAVAAAAAPCVDVDSSELSRREICSAFYGAARLPSRMLHLLSQYESFKAVTEFTWQIRVWSRFLYFVIFFLISTFINYDLLFMFIIHLHG